MYYIAVVKGTEIKFAENYSDLIGVQRRAVGLKTQAMLEGAGWQLYLSDSEPYECALARIANPPNEGEIDAAYQTRIAPILAKALKATTSTLTPTMPDDAKLA